MQQPQVWHEAAAREEVQTCLQELQETASAQQAALQRVLDVSERALGQQDATEVAPGSQGTAATAAAAERRLWWLSARLRALQHLERLGTSLALHGG